MRVQKRNGSYEEVSFDKILNRLKALASGPDFDVKLNVEPVII